MTEITAAEGDPFADPPSDDFGRDSIVDSTLAVGRNASLTLGTDSLIVLDEGFTNNDRERCCGLLPSKTAATRAIPFLNVLWADLSEFELTIQFAHPSKKNTVRVSTISYPVEKNERAAASSWIFKLLDRAYGPSQRRKRIKVLINPAGGTGRAQKWYSRDIEPILLAAGCAVDTEITRYSGHAMEIAEKLDIERYDVVASCSGDGLPHEVFNGLGKRRDARIALAKVAVVQFPCGTGNAMSLSLNGTNSPSMAALCVVKGLVTSLDLVSITQGNRRTLSFLTQSVGLVAETDLGTENLRWLGDARFTYGFLVRLLRKTIWPADIAMLVEIDTKAEIRNHYQREKRQSAGVDHARSDDSERQSEDLSRIGGDGLPPLRFGTVQDPLPDGWNMLPYDKLGNFYAGNMAWVAAGSNFFPASLPSDGCLDLVNIDGDISRMTAIKCLTAVSKGTFFDMECVNYRKVLGYRIVPKNQKEGYISIDGERVPFEPFQAEVHRGLGTVLSKSGHLYEAFGPDGR